MTTTYDDSLDDEVATVTYGHDDDSVVVIVGSGAGGGTLANELAQRGIDVVVIEAGPRFKETDFENDEYAMYDMLSWSDPRSCTGSSPIAKNFADAPTLTCKGVGGTTLHWAAMTPRFQAHEFQARSTYGAVGGANIADWPLGLEEIAPYYDRAEDKMGVTGTNGIPLPPEINNYKVMKAGGRRLGYTQIDTNNLAVNIEPRDGRNGCDQIGFCQQGCRSGAKWSTMNAEIPKAEATGRCEVRVGCMALRIEHGADGRVSGVLYADPEGHQQSQKARIVCVAGNAIETPRLLLNSDSSAHPDGLANSSGQVGKNYMRHMFGFVYGQFEQPVNMHRGLTVAGIIRDEAGFDDSRGFVGGYYFLASSLGLPYFSAFLNPGAWGSAHTSWTEAYNHTASICVLGEDMAMETNRVSLHATRKDRFGLAIPQSTPRRPPQRARHEEPRLQAIGGAVRGGRREPGVRRPAAAGIAQPRDLPHERARRGRRRRRLRPGPRRRQSVHLRRQPIRVLDGRQPDPDDRRPGGPPGGVHRSSHARQRNLSVRSNVGAGYKPSA